MTDGDVQTSWNKLNQASTDQVDADTVRMAFSGTWATGAQNPAVWAASSVLKKQIPHGAVAAQLMFVVADTAEDEIAGYVWTKYANGPPNLRMIINPIRAGTTVCSFDPSDGVTALTGFFFADHFVVTHDNTHGSATSLVVNDNGIAEVHFDLYGAADILCEFRTSVPGGTSGTDAIGFWKWI